MKWALSIMIMLIVLKDKRKTLFGDGSEVGNVKKEILDKKKETVSIKPKV